MLGPKTETRELESLLRRVAGLAIRNLLAIERIQVQVTVQARRT